MPLLGPAMQEDAMALTLYSHPFSSYCQKVLIALWERGIPFTYRHLEDPGAADERAALWPLGYFPVLLDGDRTVAESSIIIEHVELCHGGRPGLIPDDRIAALEVRFLDRVFDNHVMTPMQAAVAAALRGDEAKTAATLAETAGRLDTAYAWLETRLAGRAWAAGNSFSMADCAAAPALLYADWVHPIGEHCPGLRAYRQRLLARPSVTRAVDEARPYRRYFPLPLPDRD